MDLRPLTAGTNSPANHLVLAPKAGVAEWACRWPCRQRGEGLASMPGEHVRPGGSHSVSTATGGRGPGGRGRTE